MSIREDLCVRVWACARIMAKLKKKCCVSSLKLLYVSVIPSNMLQHKIEWALFKYWFARQLLLLSSSCFISEKSNPSDVERIRTTFKANNSSVINTRKEHLSMCLVSIRTPQLKISIYMLSDDRKSKRKRTGSVRNNNTLVKAMKNIIRAWPILWHSYVKDCLYIFHIWLLVSWSLQVWSVNPGG